LVDPKSFNRKGPQGEFTALHIVEKKTRGLVVGPRTKIEFLSEPGCLVEHY
jgi:hypothetical protein